MREIEIGGKKFEDILIGSDPEIRFEGTKARPLIPFEGKFGTDGPQSQIGELRPDPKYCPIAHVEQNEIVLRYGFRQFQKLQGVKWLAGSSQEGHPLGGHIHFGTDYRKHLELKLTALDALLAPVSLMLENPEKARERRNNSNGYGKLATHGGSINANNRGFKTKEHYAGVSHPLSHDGIEYRPLPSWLVSKQVACGLLSLAKVIAFETHNESLHKHLGPQLKFIKMDKKFYDAFTTCDKRYFAQTIPTVFRIVRSFKLFPKYEKWINYLFHLTLQGRTWDDSIDIKKRWNIMPIIKTSKAESLAHLVKIDLAWENSLSHSFVLPKAKKLFAGAV